MDSDLLALGKNGGKDKLGKTVGGKTDGKTGKTSKGHDVTTGREGTATGRATS